MPWIDPITDRTSSDIANRTAKAFFNVVDWLRIDNNTRIVHVLAEALLGVGVDLTSLPEPTTATIPDVEDINAFVGNIEAARKVGGLPGALGMVPLVDDYGGGSGTDAPDWQDVNAWERNLDILHTYLVHAAAYRVGCGIAEAGQARFFQSRFRAVPLVPAVASPARRARCDAAICGTGAMRQNKFRRYAA